MPKICNNNTPISWYNFFNKENVSEAIVAISEKADRMQNYKLKFR